MTNDAVNAILQEIYVVETPRCGFCGKTGTVEMTFQEFISFEHGHGLIQDRLPNLSPAIREQLKLGYHPECWSKNFGGHK